MLDLFKSIRVMVMALVRTVPAVVDVGSAPSSSGSSALPSRKLNNETRKFKMRKPKQPAHRAKCPTCNESFGTEAAMRQHATAKHKPLAAVRP